MALRALGSKFPSIHQLESSVTHSKVPLHELRSTIHKQRMEYYLRRYNEFGKSYAQAKVCIYFYSIITRSQLI